MDFGEWLWGGGGLNLWFCRQTSLSEAARLGRMGAQVVCLINTFLAAAYNSNSTFTCLVYITRNSRDCRSSTLSHTFERR